MTDDFAARYGRWAVIAGASEGVGASLADQLASRGLDLVLIARNGQLLEQVAAGARERHGVEVRPVVQDLTAADVGERIAEAADGLDVGLLIYNAGAANRTVEFLDDSFDDSLRQIQLACVGPVALARHFAPAMRERGRGGIVLVGSLACLSGASLLAVYSAVKAFNVNFAEGLWAELRPQGVDVVCTPLGMTYTEAFQRLGVPYDPATMMLSDDAAREIVENIGNGPTYPVGESNRTMASMIWTVDRKTLVEMTSAASIDFAAKQGTAVPDAIDHVRRGESPPVVVHPTAS
jgi:short-subunit dehydrogenase